MLGLFLIVPFSSSANARDGGEFEGAVWTIVLKPRGQGETLKATYRIANHVLYQKAKPRVPDYNVRVGTNHPEGRKTQTRFQKLTAFGPGRERHDLSGLAKLEMVVAGNWSGQFIDSSGKHWDCTVKRAQE